MLALRLAEGHLAADIFIRPIDLRQENHIPTAGDPRVQGDPTGVPSHHLQHHHPFMAGGRGVEAVEGIGGGGDRRVEAEGEGGGRQIVVDRLGNANHGDAELMQLLRDRERSISPHADQAADGELSHRLRHLLQQPRVERHSLILAEGGRETPFVGGAENGAPLREDAGGGAGIERHVADRIDQSFKTAQKSDAAIAQPFGCLDGGPDHRVEPWAVATAGQNTDARFTACHDFAPSTQFHHSSTPA